MPDNKTHETRVLSVDVSTRVATEVGRLPITYSVQTINADETLIAGAFVAPDSGKGNYRDIGPKLYGSKKKGAIAYAKFNLKETRVVYLYDLRTRQTSELFRSNYLVSNLQFSPTSPNLLMYCHEGPWHAVDRIWTIATDEKNKTLIHKRTMVAGIVGHEFWSEDGDSIWYDWQAPRGQVFYIAGKNIIDNQRYAYVLDRAAWSIHYARAPDGAFFVGDGGDKKQVARSDAPRYTQVIENLPQDPLTYQSCLNFERNRGKDVEKYAFRNATTAEQAP
jgi:oligogalacturonide lyase